MNNITTNYGRNRVVVYTFFGARAEMCVSECVSNTTA